jgi:hypothetical protein
METQGKARHSPAEFFREILIIVIGVLIALGGQQAVDWIHQQNELAETRAALRAEIASNSRRVEFGAALDHCRLGMMAKYANWGRGGPRPEHHTAVGFQPVYMSAWDVAKAGPLARMPVKERLNYSVVYDNFVNWQRNIERQIDIAQVLIQFPELEQLNSDQAQRVLELSNATQTVIGIQESNLPFVRDSVRALGISPDPISEPERKFLDEWCQASGVPAPTL